MTSPVIALAADHAGFELKNSMKVVLEEHSFPLVDLGPETADPVDYPDMAGKLAAALKDGRAQQGLLVCGTGIGIAIAANRYPWIRAAVCHDVTAARLAREHNDANVLALGARLIGPEVARDCLLTFLRTPLCRRPARATCGKNVGARGTACALNPCSASRHANKVRSDHAPQLGTVAVTGQAGVHWFTAERAKEGRSGASPDLTAANWVSPTGVPVRAT